MATAQHRLLEDEYDEYTTTNNNAAAFCRSIFLIVSISQDDKLCFENVHSFSFCFC
jgi:hypothetical protein